MRREYFARTTELYRRWVPAGGAPVAPGNDGVKQRLVATGSYHVFEALMTAWQTRGRLLRVIRPAAGPRRTVERQLPVRTG
jgi:hypothetical protein